MTEKKVTKRPWKRPEGCTCDETLPGISKCSRQWMRCNTRIRHVLDERERRAKVQP